MDVRRKHRLWHLAPLRTVALVATVAVGLAGCGGSPSGPDFSAPGTSPAATPAATAPPTQPAAQDPAPGAASPGGTEPDPVESTPEQPDEPAPKATKAERKAQQRAERKAQRKAERKAARRTATSLKGWSLRQQVGQLVMVGVPVTGASTASRKAVRKLHVGNIFLAGRTTAGKTSVSTLVDSYTGLVTKRRTRRTPLLVATDQEGGLVQVLRGTGFSEIPSAMAQARLAPHKLKKKSRTWARQLSGVGVNLNLAPVSDVVTNATTAKTNGPIGVFDRSYGYGTASVVSHVRAVNRGMRAGGVETTPKHFPGLGRVVGNTDTTANVHDRVTTARKKDPSIKAFRATINDGAQVMMISSAIYDRIDASGPATFSRPIITKLLRKKLGFDGVVMSDDVSAARALKAWTAGQRAVKFVKAGGDIVLASADASVVPQIVDALVSRAQTHPAFAKRIAKACKRVLALKGNLPARS